MTTLGADMKLVSHHVTFENKIANSRPWLWHEEYFLFLSNSIGFLLEHYVLNIEEGFVSQGAMIRVIMNTYILYSIYI